MAEQYEHGWDDPRKMSRRELEDWTDRNIPEWTDWRPKLMVPRWVIIAMYGLLLIMFAALAANAQEPVPFEEPCTVSQCVIYNQAVVLALTGDEQRVKWVQNQGDLDTMDLFFRTEGYDFPPEDPAVAFVTSEEPEGTSQTLWTPIRAGFYYFRVRACRTDIIQDPNDPAFEVTAELRHGTIDEWILCSVWALSYDATFTDPVKFPRGFTYLVQIAPATGGTIE